MSHEIRTPLTAIIGFAETLEEEPAEKDRHDAIRRIIDNGKHLLHVINGILDLSKIESKKLVVETMPVDIFEIFADTESVMGMLAREKNLAFDLDYQYPLPRFIQTDPTRFKQIIFNLCSNAIKFTEKGTIRLEIGYLAQERKLHVAVIDTGIGISQEKINRLFAPFTQADSSTTRRFGGTGLGLYISRQLAEMLGGSIDIKSVEGLGTRIDVTIGTGEIDLENMVNVIPESVSENLVNLPLSGAGQLRGRILLAEDSPDNQRLISLFARKNGAEVTVVNNGKAAVETALAGDFDLVLMDMQMPIMDGVEATRVLRQTGYPGPIVALTANAMKEDRQRCANAGCDDFLTKPIDRSEFNRVLNQYLVHLEEPSTLEFMQQAVADTLAEELLELAKEFIENLPSRISSIRAARENENWKELRTHVHQLKGIAGTFGYHDVSAKAGEIDQLLKEKQLEHLDDLLAKLYTLCTDAIIHFEQQGAKGTT